MPRRYISTRQASKCCCCSSGASTQLEYNERNWRTQSFKGANCTTGGREQSEQSKPYIYIHSRLRRDGEQNELDTCNYINYLRKCVISGTFVGQSSCLSPSPLDAIHCELTSTLLILLTTTKQILLFVSSSPLYTLLWVFGVFPQPQSPSVHWAFTVCPFTRIVDFCVFPLVFHPVPLRRKVVLPSCP